MYLKCICLFFVFRFVLFCIVFFLDLGQTPMFSLAIFLFNHNKNAQCNLKVQKVANPHGRVHWQRAGKLNMLSVFKAS